MNIKFLFIFFGYYQVIRTARIRESQFTPYGGISNEKSLDLTNRNDEKFKNLFSRILTRINNVEQNNQDKSSKNADADIYIIKNEVFNILSDLNKRIEELERTIQSLQKAQLENFYPFRTSNTNTGSFYNSWQNPDENFYLNWAFPTTTDSTDLEYMDVSEISSTSATNINTEIYDFSEETTTVDNLDTSEATTTNSQESQIINMTDCFCIEELQKTIERLSVQEDLIKQLVDRIPINRLVKTSPSNWTVIQRRKDGSIYFNRKWNDYKYGFGEPNGEFFIGLDTLYEMTSRRQHELKITLRDSQGNTRYANYNNFIIGNENEEYQLKELGTFTGDAGESFFANMGNKFSTRDNDNWNGCARRTSGAWWFLETRHCGESFLNGPFLMEDTVFTAWGIHWYSFNGNGYSFKFVEMSIRPTY